MIVVRVELHSARDGSVRELGRMIIANDGTGTTDIGNYTAHVMRKPRFMTSTRSGRLIGHARLRLTVWHLVGRLLASMGYAHEK